MMSRAAGAMIVLLVVPSFAFSQSLGDAARKEQERRKKNAEAGVKARSVDDEQLRSGTGTGKGTVSTSDGADSPSAGASSANADGPPTGSAGTVPDVVGGGVSETEQRQSRLTRWRNLYRPAKASVDSLQREVADLEERVSRTHISDRKPGYRDPNVRTGDERTLSRLPTARQELARAKARLSTIEESARRDGVSAAQLY